MIDPVLVQETPEICETLTNLTPRSPFGFVKIGLLENNVPGQLNRDDVVNAITASLSFCTETTVRNQTIDIVQAQNYLFHRDGTNGYAGHEPWVLGYRANIVFEGKTTVFFNTSIPGIENLAPHFDVQDSSFQSISMEYLPALELSGAFVHTPKNHLALWLTGDRGAIHAAPFYDPEHDGPRNVVIFRIGKNISIHDLKKKRVENETVENK